jgi:hypothetical protein
MLLLGVGGAFAFNSTVFLPTSVLTNPCADNTPVLPVLGGFPYPNAPLPSAVNEIQSVGLLIPSEASAPLPISCSAFDTVRNNSTYAWDIGGQYAPSHLFSTLS